MSYAPASPDLSSFYSGSAAPPTSSTTTTNHPQPSLTSTTVPLPLQDPGLALPVSPTPTTRQPLYQPQGQFPSQQHLQAPQQGYYSGDYSYSTNTPVSPHQRTAHPASQPFLHSHSSHSPRNHLQYAQPAPSHPPHPQQPPQAPLQGLPSTLTGQAPHNPQYYQPYGSQQHYKREPEEQPYAAQAPAPPLLGEYASQLPSSLQQSRQHIKLEEPSSYPYNEQEDMPPRRSAAAAASAPPAIMPSPVRTKFPTARIKRIMQADEEVGKVAQQTPIAVGKALELFMVTLVSKSHDVARDKGAKRVTAQHLKQVVESDDILDFLREIVGRVSETDDKKGGRSKAESEESEDEVVVDVKKKGRGGRKKKNA